MMKNLLLFAFLLITSYGYAQNSFSDDFESYNVGDYVAQASPKWTVWSGTTGEGTQEDAFVTDENARSGTKSIKFEAASPNGGPTDLVLPFGGEINLGKFNFQMYIYVVPDQSGYFNFQGKATLGQIWCFQGYFDGDGKFRADMGAGSSQFIETDYSSGEWMKFNLTADLTNNVWEVFLNDKSLAKFANINNSIASLDIFPVYRSPSVASTFYVDDVSYSLEEYVRPNLEVTVLNALYKPRFLANKSSGGDLQIRNIGQTTINDLEIKTTLGNGTPVVTNLTGLNLAPLALRNITMPDLVYSAGTNDLTIEVTKVNNTNDSDQNNNKKTTSLTGVVPAQYKAVLAEEATGTWCQWCPRGAVFMDSMAKLYHTEFIGVAVHGGSASEPMRIPLYDAGLTSVQGFPGFPSVLLDRTEIIDPSDLEPQFYDNIVIETPVKLTNGAIWNATTGDLTVSVKADFLKSISGDYRFNMILIENGVKGTTAAYNQSNAYSGGRNGVMGGFEKLPNPVPASRMIYNHVARIIMDGFDGIAGYLPNSINAGATHHITYTTNIPIAWKEANIEIIGLITGPGGEIVNATKATIEEAEKNGLYTSTENPNVALKPMSVLPNPAHDNSQVSIELEHPAQVNMEVIDITGRVMMSRNYGQLQGELVLPIRTENLESGIYTIRLSLDGSTRTQKLVVNH